MDFKRVRCKAKGKLFYQNEDIGEFGLSITSSKEISHTQKLKILESDLCLAHYDDMILITDIGRCLTVLQP